MKFASEQFLVYKHFISVHWDLWEIFLIHNFQNSFPFLHKNTSQPGNV